MIAGDQAWNAAVSLTGIAGERALDVKGGEFEASPIRDLTAPELCVRAYSSAPTTRRTMELRALAPDCRRLS